MLWIGLLAVLAVLAAARFWWDRRRGYVEEVVPFNFSAEQVDAARHLMEKERSNREQIAAALRIR